MKALAVVILDKFADWEPALLTAGLQSIIGGYTVRWASVDREVKTSMGGLRVEPDMTISEIPSTADAVIVIGAEGSWRTLSAEDSQQLASILRSFKDAGKPVGGICDGAYFLASAGLLDGRRHTANGFEDIKDLAGYTNPHQYVNTTREAVRDKNLVTASGLGFVDFTFEMLHALGDIPDAAIEQFNQMLR